MRKVVCQNWRFDEKAGAHPKRRTKHRVESPFADCKRADVSTRKQRIRFAVRQALGRLTELERDTIERFYFHGEAFLEISILTGMRLHRIRSAHSRAMRKLRRQLAGFVKKEFGLTVSFEPDCPICNSEHRKEIERLLQQRGPATPLQPLLDRLAKEFDLTLKTSSVLVHHEKFH